MHGDVSMDFFLRRDNYIMKKVRVVPLARNMPTGSPPHPHQIVSQTVWELRPAKDSGFRGDNYITKKARVVSLVRNMPTDPLLQSYQIISKYVDRYQSYGAHKNASTDGRHADRYIPRTYRSWDKIAIHHEMAML